MKKYLITFCIIIIPIANKAQSIDQIASLSVLANKNAVEVSACNLADFPVLDTAQIVIVYDFYSRYQHTEPLLFSDAIILKIGSHYSQCYPKTYFRIDSLQTFKGISITAPMILDMEINQNFKSNSLCVTNRLPGKWSGLLSYAEPIPIFKWIISSDIYEICGYNCYVATTRFRGRDWKAWFAPDIPYRVGPFKFGGLPGLILRAESIDGDYIFTCSSVKNAKVSISGVNKKSTVLEKKKVQAKIVSFCQSPLFYLGGTPNAQNKFYVKEKQLDDSWVISYNPIELE